jgi:TetR/AcrR family transcriptional regulator
MNAEPARVRDPDGTKRSVLDAAERLFAERGFAGTSLRDIAVASGVSHPLIQHHFGTKEGLYSAVLRRCGEDYAERFPELVGGTDQPLDLRAEMERLFGVLREKGALLRMVGWARLEGRHELLPGGGEARRAMVRRIELGQRLGLVRGDIDAATLGVMMEALLFYWIDYRSFNSELYPDTPEDDVYLEKAIALLERGFAPQRGMESREDSPRRHN